MPVPVMAAIVAKGNDILICQRKDGALAGKWEFPGGKIENGETPEECLVRELREELDIEIAVDGIFKAVNMHYDHGDFLLLSYLARYVSGEINLRVHSDYAWVEARRLTEFDLANANVPIAQSLQEQSDAAWARMSTNGRSN